MINIDEYIKLPKEERQKHICLDEECHLRNTYSLELRGLLAFYLDTNVPRGHKIVLAHACHNPDCSNPKHLYWASSRENSEDKMSNNPELRFKLGKKGSSTHNYGARPWEITNGHIESWAKAQFLYDNYFSKGWDYKKYSQGISYFSKKYGIAVGSKKRMLQMFNEGWIPNADLKWIERFGN